MSSCLPSLSRACVASDSSKGWSHQRRLLNGLHDWRVKRRGMHHQCWPPKLSKPFENTRNPIRSGPTWPQQLTSSEWLDADYLSGDVSSWHFCRRWRLCWWTNPAFDAWTASSSYRWKYGMVTQVQYLGCGGALVRFEWWSERFTTWYATTLQPELLLPCAVW